MAGPATRVSHPFTRDPGAAGECTTPGRATLELGPPSDSPGTSILRAQGPRRRQSTDTCNATPAASPLSLPPSLAPSTLIVTSSSLSSASSLSIPSPSDPAQSLTLSHDDWHKAVLQLKQEGAALKEAEFLLKGVEPPKPAAQKAALAPTPGAAAATKGTAQAELEGQSGVQLGITVKKEQAVFGDWYQQVLIKGEMLDYYDISGCYILKPWSYGIWQEIQSASRRLRSPQKSLPRRSC